MAAAFVDKALKDKVASSKILMVGAGGIGCELLKNLVLTGFVNIEMIDLDTIDVSNLNRQFLFRREHVGKSKSQVAKESALKFNPKAKIKAYHDTIISQDYDVNFYKQFDMVMNALDNTSARNHVNKMCLAANVPLIESGTAGYLGQVTVIKKGETECYECQPKPRQKTFPGCTIRNTPSEPIHCIVWAKHLFNQLFGEDDPDQDVSPDGEDPELMADAGKSALEHEAVNNGDAVGGILRRSTRDWAHSINYDAVKIFTKLFCNDIKYLLSMDTLWKSRRPPTPLNWQDLPTEVSGDSPNQSEMRDQRVESVESYANMFKDSLSTLRDELAKQGSEGILVWDKDEDPAMDFVTAAANIRAHIFGIPLKSRFDIKSMAGNIIPAIATTNAVVAALIVMESLKILQGRLADCKTVYLTKKPNPRKRILVPCTLMKPNPKCLACCEKPEVAVKLNTATTTVKTLEDKILKSKLGMAAPDVQIDDDKGSILISSEEGETEQNSDKFLTNFGIRNGSRLVCDDFLQCYNLVVNIIHADKLEDDQEFEIIGDMSQLHAKPEEEPSTSNNGGSAENEDNDVVEIVEDEQINTAPKRKRSVDGESATSIKKRKTSMSVEIEDDDCVMID